MHCSILKNWSMFKDLDFEAVTKIQMIMVFAPYYGIESFAIIVDKNKNVFCTNSLASLLYETEKEVFGQKLENLCGKDMKTFACGPDYILALTEDGQVYSCNYRNKEAWKNNTNFLCNKPILMNIRAITSNKTIRIVDIACHKHSLALAEDGEVFAWGQNQYGQLGLNHNKDQNLPQQIIRLAEKKIIQIACGSNFSMAVTDNGEVYGWGLNNVGQVGTDYPNSKEEPCRINLQNIVKVACGRGHTIALCNEGKLYVWGYNSSGELGIGNTSRMDVPIMITDKMGRVSDIATLISSDISVAINKNGHIYMWGVCSGHIILSPVKTEFLTVYDVLAVNAKPQVMHKPLILHKNEDITSYNRADSDIIEFLKNAFNDESTSDLTIKVDDQLIHVHKAILKIRSAYFRKMFRPNWPENNQSVIEHTEFSYAVFKAFLEYLYTGLVTSDVTVEKALELLKLADAYCEDSLKQRCIQLIKEKISITNVLFLYTAALNTTKEVEEFCLKFAVNHIAEVTRTEDFINLEDKTLKTFVSRAAEAGAFRKI